jgi:hypothetical protein
MAGVLLRPLVFTAATPEGCSSELHSVTTSDNVRLSCGSGNPTSRIERYHKDTTLSRIKCDACQTSLEMSPSLPH